MMHFLQHRMERNRHWITQPHRQTKKVNISAQPWIQHQGFSHYHFLQYHSIENIVQHEQKSSPNRKLLPECRCWVGNVRQLFQLSLSAWWPQKHLRGVQGFWQKGWVSPLQPTAAKNAEKIKHLPGLLLEWWTCYCPAGKLADDPLNWREQRELASLSMKNMWPDFQYFPQM